MFANTAGTDGATFHLSWKFFNFHPHDISTRLPVLADVSWTWQAGGNWIFVIRRWNPFTPGRNAVGLSVQVPQRPTFNRGDSGYGSESIMLGT